MSYKIKIKELLDNIFVFKKWQREAWAMRSVESQKMRISI